MPSPHLRVTRRCLVNDLGLNGDLVKQDARQFQDEHPAVQKFVGMRGADPGGAEPIHGTHKFGVIGSLHVGSARAVTTWDEVEDVCWLIGYSDFHRNGHPQDAYKVFSHQYESGILLPANEDWEEFFADPADSFLEMLCDTGRQLVELARADTGHEQVKTFHDGGHQVICVDVVVEGDERAEEGWMGLTLPADEVLSDSDVYDMVASLLPADVTPIYEHEKFKDRPRRRGEIVYRWEHYEVGTNDDATQAEKQSVWPYLAVPSRQQSALPSLSSTAQEIVELVENLIH